MTFEEFFIKKKIDLGRLKLAEPVLFEEFRFDYSLMGEKSFDHTKKFWFNKLRKIYHLKPDQKLELKKPQINALASQAVPLSSPAIDEKPVYSPRFKPRVASQPVETNVAEDQPTADSEKSAEISKPAYKPRFKAAAIKSEPAERPAASEPESSSESHAAPEPEVKPVYKPRFKPGMMNKPKTKR